MRDTARELRARFEALAGRRGPWEAHWQEIAERVLPRQAGFTGRTTPGAKRNEKIFDSTAPLALERFAAAMESMLTPRGQRWHHLRVADEELGRRDDVRAWLEAVERRLFASRYAPRANYASQQHEIYMSLGAFGTGAMFLGDDPVAGPTYRAIHLGELYVDEDAHGRIDTVFRKFELTARQARQFFGADRLPDTILRAGEDAGDRKFAFLHAVFPRTARNPAKLDSRNMCFASWYLALDGNELIGEGGYRTFPYMISRYVTAPGEVYGRSPAMAVLPDIKMLNEAARTIIRAAHRQVDPPILVHDDGVLGPLNLQPNAVNVGGLSPTGEPLAKPFNSGGKIDIGQELLEAWRGSIKDAFLVSLFQVLTDHPNMTATEALVRVQEKGALIAPAVGRQHSEALGPMIAREIDILTHRRALPPAPPVLAEARADLEIRYDSPMARAQRAQDVSGIARLVETVAPLLRMHPSVVDLFDADAIVRLAGEAYGVPHGALRAEADVEAHRARAAEEGTEPAPGDDVLGQLAGTLGALAPTMADDPTSVPLETGVVAPGATP